MDAVKPKYAIPFASNHVHLHKDVYSSNSIVNDPFMLLDTLNELGNLKSKFKIMLSGDIWDSNTGFHLNKKSEEYLLIKTKWLNVIMKIKGMYLRKILQTRRSYTCIRKSYLCV